MKVGYVQFTSAFGDVDKSIKKIDSKSKEWTPEKINQQINCLTTLLEIEKENIKLIENELKN